MCDSTETTITYRAIQKRAESVALEYTPDFPKQGTFEGWESFQDELEALDSYEIAHESCDWDWVIYYHRAMELCQAVPSSVLHEAESQWHEMSGPDGITEQFGLYEFASELAAQIVVQEIAEAVERVKDELIDLAQTQMDNL